MTNTVAFPSDRFPAFPAVAVDAPDDWVPINALGSVLAVGQPPSAGNFRSNVVIAMSRFDAGYQLQTAIDAVVKKFTELPDFVEIGREERTVLGVPGFRMEVTFSDPRVGTLAQAIHLAVIEAGPVADLVQVTGTAAGEQGRDSWPTVRSVLDSARSV